jgi:hypothetical protein
MQRHHDGNAVAAKHAENRGAQVMVDVVKVGDIGSGLADQFVQARGGLAVPDQAPGVADGRPVIAG